MHHQEIQYPTRCADLGHYLGFETDHDGTTANIMPLQNTSWLLAPGEYPIMSAYDSCSDEGQPVTDFTRSFFDEGSLSQLQDQLSNAEESLDTSPISSLHLVDNLLQVDELEVPWFYKSTSLPVTTTPHTTRKDNSDTESDERLEDSETEKKSVAILKPLSRRTSYCKRSPEPRITKRKTSSCKRRNAVVLDEEVNDLSNAQNTCCLSGCENGVTNRLRFSLRRTHCFKDDFLLKGYNKICQYHYFSDLYQHKKLTVKD
ncbi:developmentally-regulated protein [Acrasis kona]|uniref:Developmentally-regulated protein n=1 Tax=Acrasis kona TaxID=1008807 RepID=A0AAW2YPJ2_9EUKA